MHRNQIRSTLLWIVAAAALVPGSLLAQTLQGLAVEEGDDRVVTGALVRLMDADGDQVAFVVTGDGGAYVLQAPAPGDYRVVAERIGYEPFRTPLLAVAASEGVYTIDLLMRRAPLALPGITVTADRLEAIEREVRLDIGLSPRSLSVAPIFRTVIEEHLAKGHRLEDLIRWSQLPSIIVKTTTEGPCFQYRNRGCLDVYLNRMILTPEAVPVVPLEVAETIVVVMPNESILYPRGAVLLYTSGWIGGE